MTNVVSLQDITKDEQIKKLEEELKSYRDEQKIADIETEIMEELSTLTKTFMLTITLEDKDMVIRGLQDFLEKIRKVNSD